MKKELFEKIVELYKNNHKAEPKITVKENFISYSFSHNGNCDTEEFKKFFKEHGYKGENVKDLIKSLPLYKKRGCISINYYTTLIYDYVKDKISISNFKSGWNWADRKQRFYPMARRNPVLCYSKHLYYFLRIKKDPIMVRHFKGSSLQGMSSLERRATELILGIDYRIEAYTGFLAKHYRGTKDEYGAIENAHGIKIPKAIKEFSVDSLAQLVSVMANPGELNTICQYLNENSDDTRDNIFDVVRCMIGFTPNDNWLLTDYIRDLTRLKRKTFSLKVTSRKRIEDEHRKMTKEIMMLGIKEIKVKEHYKDVMINFPILKAELIENKERLIAESVDQDHCVATYAGKINSGECCIISMLYEDKQWTLEIMKNSNHYYINQFKGLRNCNPPEELQEILKQHLVVVNTELVYKYNLKLETA